MLGDLLATAGAIFAAVYVLIGRQVRPHLSLVPYSASVYLVAAGGLAAAMALTGTPFAGYSAQVWALFLAMTVGPQFLGHTVINHLLGELKASIVSVALLAEAVGATVLAYLVFGERPGIQVVVGGAIVLAGGRRSPCSPRSDATARGSRDARGVVSRAMDGRRRVTLDEWEAAAREVLPLGVFDYVAGGAGAERTLAANEEAFERWTSGRGSCGGPARPIRLPSCSGCRWRSRSGSRPGRSSGRSTPTARWRPREPPRRSGIPMCVSSTVLDRRGRSPDRAAPCGGSSTSGAIGIRPPHCSNAPPRPGTGRSSGPWTCRRSGSVSRHPERLRLPVGPPGTPQEFDPDISWEDLRWIRERAPGMPMLVKGDPAGR